MKQVSKKEDKETWRERQVITKLFFHDRADELLFDGLFKTAIEHLVDIYDRAVAEGFENPTIETEKDYDYGTYININGSRPETDEEWQKRVTETEQAIEEQNKAHQQRLKEIEEAGVREARRLLNKKGYTVIKKDK